MDFYVRVVFHGSISAVSAQWGNSGMTAPAGRPRPPSPCSTAGIEYFDMLATVLGGRLRCTTPMLFALAFIPQFLIGGLTGIMVVTPALDYQANGSYFVV
jgi:hypothetical protein